MSFAELHHLAVLQQGVNLDLLMGDGARLVPAQDEGLVEVLTAGLIDLIDNPSERARLGAAGAAG